MLEILAEDVDTMTVQDLLGLGKILHVKDLQNLTQSRFKRLNWLANQRDSKTLSTAVDADELNRKLGRLEGLEQIARRPSLTPSEFTQSTTPGPTLDEEIASVYRAYKRLKEMGGRPSAEINPEPGPCDPSKSDIDKDYHVSDHWHREGNRIGDELVRWSKFCRYQQRMQGDHEIFRKYIGDVSKYMRKAGMEWSVELQPEHQTKLDEWKEYYIYERRRHCRLKKMLAQIQQLPELKRDNGQLWSTEEALEKLEPVLEWIEGQLIVVAEECAISSQNIETDGNHMHQAERPNSEPQIPSILVSEDSALQLRGKLSRGAYRRSQESKTETAEVQATWRGRLRVRRNSTMAENQTMWQHRPRPRPGCGASLEKSKAAKRRTGKPKGIIKQYRRKPSKKRQRPILEG